MNDVDQMTDDIYDYMHDHKIRYRRQLNKVIETEHPEWRASLKRYHEFWHYIFRDLRRIDWDTIDRQVEKNCDWIL